MENDQDYSMKQLDLFGNCDPEDAGYAFAVAENVGGLFSADDGLALARCIRELLDCGACETGWRLLDSQYFGCGPKTEARVHCLRFWRRIR